MNKKLLACAVAAFFSMGCVSAGATEVTRTDEVRVDPDVKRHVNSGKKKVKRAARKAKRKAHHAASRTRAAGERAEDRTEAAANRARDNVNR